MGQNDNGQPQQNVAPQSRVIVTDGDYGHVAGHQLTEAEQRRIADIQARAASGTKPGQ